ncbi:MAG: Hsp70 family protein, partial [Myxococcota bacterium]
GDTVISVPAYYNDNQRGAVKKAGELAGLQVKRIVSEPTAAALAYGFNRGFDQKILVFDLGGGTFDVSVLEVSGNVFQVIATGGDTFLGGVDFDERIIAHVLEVFRREHKMDLSEDPVVLQRIRNASEAAKMDLSLLSNVVVTLPYVTTKKGKPVDLRIPLSREDLNALTSDLVDRAFGLCDEVLGSKGIAPGDIDEIILVGGQTRMPLVQDRIREHFGKNARKGVHPEECVALGAALLADSLDQIDAVTLIDVLSMPIGIAAPGGRFKKVIDKNVSVPHERSFGLPPASSEGGDVEIDVFQGESDNIVDNEYLGSVRFPRGVGKVTFMLTEEGILEISVADAAGSRRAVSLATRKTPPSLRRAIEEDMERRRLAAEAAEQEEESGGLFASIRRVFGKD